MNQPVVLDQMDEAAATRRQRLIARAEGEAALHAKGDFPHDPNAIVGPLLRELAKELKFALRREAALNPNNTQDTNQ